MIDRYFEKVSLNQLEVFIETSSANVKSNVKTNVNPNVKDTLKGISNVDCLKSHFTETKYVLNMFLSNLIQDIN